MELTIDLNNREATKLIARGLTNLTKGALVEELRSRGIGIPKLKEEMQDRLAHHLVENDIKVTISFGTKKG